MPSFKSEKTPNKSTKQALLDLGEEQLLKKGLHGFSFHDLAALISLKSAAIHYHFPQKKHLTRAVLHKGFETLYELKERTANQKEEDKLRALLDQYTELYNESKTCVQAALLFTWDDLDEGLKKELTRYHKELLQYMTQVLQGGLSKGQFTFKEPPQVQALLIMSQLMSALLLCRMLGKDDFWTMRNAILRSIRA
jgi:AcrR family transcriptional regulator